MAAVAGVNVLDEQSGLSITALRVAGNPGNRDGTPPELASGARKCQSTQPVIEGPAVRIHVEVGGARGFGPIPGAGREPQFGQLASCSGLWADQVVEPEAQAIVDRYASITLRPKSPGSRVDESLPIHSLEIIWPTIGRSGINAGAAPCHCPVWSWPGQKRTVLARQACERRPQGQMKWSVDHGKDLAGQGRCRDEGR